MEGTSDFKGEAKVPSPDDLLSIPQIARLYGVKAGSVRLWKMQPTETIILGAGRKLKLYRRADVEAYANSERRQNRLKAQKVRHSQNLRVSDLEQMLPIKDQGAMV